MRPFVVSTIVFLGLFACGITAHQFFGLGWWFTVMVVVVYLHLLVLGAINIRWDFYLRSRHRGTDPHAIALTFDDGPAAETAAILDILKREGVPAAFFTIGKNAAAYPELVRRWDAEGHLIGNHSYLHGFHFDWKSGRAMAKELEQTNEVVRQITGKTPKLFRPPYGVTNPNVAKAVRFTGMTSVGWSIRSFDTTAKDEQQLLRRILGHLRGGDIILLHDSMPVTRQILTSLIQTARQKGFTFVPLNQLLDLEAYA